MKTYGSDNIEGRNEIAIHWDELKTEPDRKSEGALKTTNDS